MPSHGSLTKAGRNKKERQWREIIDEHGNRKKMMHKKPHKHPRLAKRRRYEKYLKKINRPYKESYV